MSLPLAQNRLDDRPWIPSGPRVNEPASDAVAWHAGSVLEGTDRGRSLIDGDGMDVGTYERSRASGEAESVRSAFIGDHPGWRICHLLHERGSPVRSSGGIPMGILYIWV